MWQFEVQFRQGGELNLGEMYLKLWKQLLWKLFDTDKDKKTDLEGLNQQNVKKIQLSIILTGANVEA